MQVDEWNPTIKQGATFQKQVTWLQSNGSPVDLTSYSIRGKIKRKASDPKELVSFICTITDATNGIFTISLTSTQTASLPTAYQIGPEKVNLECVYDIEAVTGSNVYRILEGSCFISPEVTR